MFVRMSQAKSLFVEIRQPTEFQTCCKFLVFLDPDPAELREGCHRISDMWQIPCVFLTLTPRVCVRGVIFYPPPEIQTTRLGRGNRGGFRLPPSRGHQQFTVSSRQQYCNSGNWKLQLVQGAANPSPTAWWPHKGASGLGPTTGGSARKSVPKRETAMAGLSRTMVAAGPTGAT